MQRCVNVFTQNLLFSRMMNFRATISDMIMRVTNSRCITAEHVHITIAGNPQIIPKRVRMVVYVADEVRRYVIFYD